MASKRRRILPARALCIKPLNTEFNTPASGRGTQTHTRAEMSHKRTHAILMCYHQTCATHPSFSMMGVSMLFWSQRPDDDIRSRN